MSAKAKKPSYKCTVCGYQSAGYMGKCPSCGTWNSFEEETQTVSATLTSSNRTRRRAQSFSEVSHSEEERLLTGIEEFNRVMGGGVVSDSVTILTARPGAGKSTLLLQVAEDFSRKGKKVLYASGEESARQIRSRAERILDKTPEHLWIYAGNSLEDVVEEAEDLDVDVLILDSVQTFTSANSSSRAGSPTQVMTCAEAMVQLAKSQRRRVVFLVGQMTKADELAGVRALEHLVDVVLLIEGDAGEELRMLFSRKNRYGSTGEMGFFRMGEKGMISIDNPSEYFMTHRAPGQEVPGCALTVLREGTRPILVEVEALVSRSFLPAPIRIGECMKREHLQTLLSILEERANKRLYDKNVVVKTTGNISLREGAASLATLMAVVSSLEDRPIPSGTIFLADVGLTGELKRVPNLTQRIGEAKRMGYRRIITAPLEENIEGVIGCRLLTEAIEKGFR